MEINNYLSSLLYSMCGIDTDSIHSTNRYLGRLYELKFELEDAMIECEAEISKVEQERKQS